MSVGSIFLPRYSGVRPTMSPAMKTASTASTRMPYRPEPDAARRDLRQHDVHEHDTARRTGSSSRARRSRRRSKCRSSRRRRRRCRGCRTAPPCPPCCRPRPRRPAAASTCGFGCASKAHASSTEPIQSDGHDRCERVALAAVADHLAERAGERERDHEEQGDLEQVRERIRVLERVGGVRVVEAAAVRSEFLDRLLRRDGTARDRLRARPARWSTSRASLKFCTTPCETQHDRRDERDRQQDADRGSDEVRPEVADRLALDPREPADQRDRDRDADRRRHEVLHGEADHLHEVAHRRLTRVRLPVRVRRERRRPC